MQSHGPFKNYKIETKKNIGFINSKYTVLEQDYLSSIHEVDSGLRCFMDSLHQGGFDTTSLIVLFGDHRSNAFPEKNKCEQIPLLIYSPMLKQQHIKTVGSQIDLAPTITHLLGIKEPAGWLGSSMFSQEKDRTYSKGMRISLAANGKCCYTDDTEVVKFNKYSDFMLK